MKKINRHLHPRLFDPSVCCNGPALSVLSRGVIVRVFRHVIDRCAAPQNPSGARPGDGSSDRSVGCLELRGELETVLLCSTTLVRVRMLEKPTHIRPRTRHRPWTAQWCGDRRHRQVTVGEGFFDDTEDIVAGGASLSSVEITNNQVHFLVEHHCTNGQQQFLTDTTLLGVIVVDVKICHFERILTPEQLTSKRGTS